MSWLTQAAAWVRSGGRRAAPSVSSSASASTLVEFDREPPREWVDQITAFAPLTATSAGLAIHYETGDRWQPIHRWFLWQLQPWGTMQDERSWDAIKRELSGPSPRTNARLDYLPRTVNGKTELRPHIRGGPCRIIDRRQWELHQQYKRQGVLVYPRRFWVIQGDQGGHRFLYDQEDEALRTAQGLPGEAPSAGDLPYAPFDQRVLDAVQAYDLWRWANGRDVAQAGTNARIRRWTEVEKAANKLRWAQASEHYAKAGDELRYLMRKEGMHHLRHRPVGWRAPRQDADAVEQAFLTDTNWSQS